MLYVSFKNSFCYMNCNILFWNNERTHQVNEKLCRRISIAERTSKNIFDTLLLSKVLNNSTNGHFILKISFRVPLGRLKQLMKPGFVNDRNLSVGCGRTGSSNNTSLIAVTQFICFTLEGYLFTLMLFQNYIPVKNSDIRPCLMKMTCRLSKTISRGVSLRSATKTP